MSMNSLSRPVNPRPASNAALVPIMPPQPQVSFVIAGSATARGMSAIGAWYSAMPTAWREPRRVETEQSARRHRHAERPPGRRGVVLRLALVQEDARAHGDLVADEHGLEELRGRRAPALGRRPARRG